MDHSQPELIIFECFASLVLCVIGYHVADCRNSKHNGWMSETTAEEQVELYKFVQCRIAYYFTIRGCEHLVIENEHVRAKDVNIWIPLEEIHLHFESFGHAYVVSIHSGNEICIQFQCYLNACIKGFW